MKTYKIIRHYFQHDKQTIKTGLTLSEARDHCNDLETSSTTCKGKEGTQHTEKYGPWFDGYDEE